MIINIDLFVRIFRTVVTLTVIAFITPQISITYYDYVLRTIHSTGIFLNYPSAKKFVIRFTWLCILSYVLLNILLYF